MYSECRSKRWVAVDVQVHFRQPLMYIVTSQRVRYCKEIRRDEARNTVGFDVASSMPASYQQPARERLKRGLYCARTCCLRVESFCRMSQYGTGPTKERTQLWLVASRYALSCRTLRWARLLHRSSL